jgi:hypothetical protein
MEDAMKNWFVRTSVVLVVVAVFVSCDLTGQVQAIIDKLTAIEENQTVIGDELATVGDTVESEFADISVTVDFADTQYDQTGPTWVFEMFFPNDAAIAAARVDPNVLIPSSGPTLGATIVTINVHTDTLFYITGARIENIRYRTVLASVPLNYIHPVLGDICPVFSTLPTSTSYTGSTAAIPVNTGVDNIFEVGLSTELSLWDHIDYDDDGLYYWEDQDEIIELQGSLFFEGFLLDGREFSGSFPMPLHLDMTIAHTP